MALENTNAENQAPNAPEKPQDRSKGNGPIQTFRYKGAFIKLWKQESEKAPFVTASIGKTYRDNATGEFKESYSLGENDLAKVDFLMPEARKEMAQWHAYYREQGQQHAPQQQLDLQRQSPGQRPQVTAPDMAATRDHALGTAAAQQSVQTHTIKHER